MIRRKIKGKIEMRRKIEGRDLNQPGASSDSAIF